MTTLFWIWSAVLALVAALWASRHAMLTRAARRAEMLSSRSFDGPPQPAPQVSVLVAAKDEEHNIEACVTSLLEQQYPSMEVIAVNDRSGDGTQAILDRLASRNGVRLKTIEIKALRDGWFGKNHAMHEGVAQSNGEWLCFTDADCRQVSPHTITMAMRYALEHEIDFLSVLPVLETRTFWEKVLQPVCAAIMVIWFRPDKVNDPSSPTAYANGAFMLMKRELYDAIGGHHRVRTEVNEDMHMARMTKQAGRRLYVVQNEDLYQTRMYSSFSECWRGWSRIFYGCFGTLRRLVVTALLLSVASILPWASLLAGIIGWVVTGHPDPWRILTAVAAVAVAVQMSLLYRFYRVNRSDPRYVLTYILGAVIALGMLLNAMTKLRGLTTTTWRGTRYRGSEVST